MNTVNNKTLLLVEDEPLIAMAEQIELEKFGYTVFTAYSGEEAIQIFNEKKNHIDLILMDIDLGAGLDGTEAAEIILKEKEIPIVFLSSHTEPEIVEKTEDITSYGYVVKNSGITVLDASIKMAFKLFEANRAVKSREAEYKSTVDNLLVGVVVHAGDTSILFSNPEASNILGLSAEQIAGKEAADPAWSFVHEDSTPMKIEDYPVSKVIATKKPLNDYIAGIKRPDRDYTTWVDVHAVPIISSEGELENIIINFINITEHKQAEQKIEQLSQFRESIIDNANIWLNVLDENANVVVWNKAAEQISGYTREEVFGESNIWEWFYPD
ncbi:MAG: PAS domain S-box protein, partial [bacterium]|nr:PAS domain S-box protein [bacterium]